MNNSDTFVNFTYLTYTKLNHSSNNKIFMLNAIIQKFFGLGIMLVIGLALLFPYVAIELHSLTIFFLFFLMIINSTSINWGDFKYNRENIWKIVLANLIIFLGVPFIVFLFASFLLSDNQYIYGAIFSALTPTAIVAPFFTKTLKGNKELSYSILITSMLISPIAIPFLLKIMVGSLPISSVLIFRDILILVPLPFALGFIIWKYLPKFSTSISKNGPTLNFIFLGFLVFILFGVSFNKFNFNDTSNVLLLKLLSIVFVQDFGMIILWGFLSSKFKNSKDWLAIIISVSMKNIAIAAGILLLHDPKAALVPALGFIAHAFLFTPFILKKLLIVPKQKVTN
jgi:bile acid:Na+ symporter, BASS family